MQFGGGFTGTATTGATAPFSFGLTKTSAPALGTLTSTPSTGFSFGLNKTSASTGLLGKL